MKVLLVEGAPGSGRVAEDELRGAGHTVVGCGPADPSAPCRGLEPISTCPLDDGNVDVAVVSRVGGDISASERGALCAARTRVPVVLTGDPRHAVSFGPGTHLAGDDLIGACERAAGSGAAHASAARRALLLRGVIDPADVATADSRVAFHVDREPGRLRLVITTAEDEPRLASIVKAAAEAIRRYDPHVPVIDVVTATR